MAAMPKHHGRMASVGALLGRKGLGMAATPRPATVQVASEIRRRRPRVGTAKLHKLLYYVQGYHLAWNDRPAFDDAIQAWEMGPVVAALWRAEKRGRPVEGSEPPPENVRNVITYVLRRVGDCTGSELIEATHAEDPWREATRAGRLIENQVISHESMARFFSQESPDLQRIREAVKAAGSDAPFEPDPPGLREALLAELSPQ